ncbi:MAG: glycosyltransferase family 2 protein [Candidatus Omnitrophica bacterium]|nr:glycosyltransferase family 2 protein [Candidatus Omnitrophota bacterium]
MQNPSQDRDRIDIIILNFNQEADTSECILSLKRMNYKNYRIILVDNGSTDGSGDRLKKRFNEADYIKSDVNLGFAGGCNLGIKSSFAAAAAGHVLLLNNDTVAGENLLTSLLKIANSENAIGILGAVNYYYSRPEKVHMAAHRFLWWSGIQGIKTGVKKEFEEVQSVSACCMLIKKEVIERIGLLDERFFIYYEDSDFCLRAGRAGFKVAAVRDAKVWHKISKIIGRKTAKEYYIYTRNQPFFMIKNCPGIFLPVYFLVYSLKVFIRIGWFFVTGKRPLSSAVRRGLADFIRGRFGKGRLFE